MWQLTFNPTAGFILNVNDEAAPGPLTAPERERIRSLARRAAEIAAEPAQTERRELWLRHNRLEKVRPLLLVFLEDSWLEVLPQDRICQIRDPFWRHWEWYLAHLIYRHEHLHDDFVFEPDLYVMKRIRYGDMGLAAKQISTGQAGGSYSWEAPIREPADARKLHAPTIEVDDVTTERHVRALKEALGDLLAVKVHCKSPSSSIYDTVAWFRGIEQTMLDMYDRPEWLHDLMRFFAETNLAGAKFLEDGGHLTLNNRNHYTDAGGIGYTDELPRQDRKNGKVRLADLWIQGVAQAASEVGPDQHEEFILNYDLRLLDKAGLVAYGCCEPYTNKFDMLKRRVKNLRRVSVSPWCDVEKAATALQDKYIYSWKPNPAMLVGRFDEGRIRQAVRRTLEVARDCVLEIILKDTITVDNEPRRIEEFIRIVREEIGA